MKGYRNAKMSDRKAVIKNADMSEEMQQDAVDCATQALEKYNIEKDIASYIKKEFDKKYNPTWHCIVGRNFGSYVTHETRHFIYFYLGQTAILLFKNILGNQTDQSRNVSAGLARDGHVDGRVSGLLTPGKVVRSTAGYLVHISLLYGYVRNVRVQLQDLESSQHSQRQVAPLPGGNFNGNSISEVVPASGLVLMDIPALNQFSESAVQGDVENIEAGLSGPGLS
ncbi:hypothetical protein J6590_052837 [Homalodisca vitripennis]|nr:hypothetical protein J6590_052837 [Homalodisca vitripennis]